MVPLATLWGTYIALAQGAYQLAVKSALGGLNTAMFVFTFVVIYGLTNLSDDVEKQLTEKQKQKGNEKTEISHDEIRNSILTILYKKAETSPLNSSVSRKTLVEVLKVPENIVDFNWIYLEQEKLIESVALFDPTVGKAARITSSGINVIEHKDENVNRYPFLNASILPIQINTRVGLVNL
jgi:hypothetical protein